jgi:hypothetical protein
MYNLGMSHFSSNFLLSFFSKVLRNGFHLSFPSFFVNPFLLVLLLTLASIPSISHTSPYYGFLNKRVRYAIELAIARYPIIVIRLAMVEATKGG